jgi:hypothetical protein
MKTTTHTSFGSRAGFTITEVVLATGVFSMAMSIMMGAHVLTMREVGGDSNHVKYIDDTRASEQFIVNMIQGETAVGVTSDGLEVYDQDFQRAFTIRFVDEDGDPGTVDDNTLVSDPDPGKTGDEPDGSGGVQPVVRIRNGEKLPDGGLSIASDLPVYVEGNYNVEGDTKPALVTGDAVTLLSQEWQDARSASGIDSRGARSTIFNTVGGHDGELGDDRPERGGVRPV